VSRDGSDTQAEPLLGRDVSQDPVEDEPEAPLCRRHAGHVVASGRVRQGAVVDRGPRPQLDVLREAHTGRQAAVEEVPFVVRHLIPGRIAEVRSQVEAEVPVVGLLAGCCDGLDRLVLGLPDGLDQVRGAPGGRGAVGARARAERVRDEPARTGARIGGLQEQRQQGIAQLAPSLRILVDGRTHGLQRLGLERGRQVDPESNADQVDRVVAAGPVVEGYGDAQVHGALRLDPGGGSLVLRHRLEQGPRVQAGRPDEARPTALTRDRDRAADQWDRSHIRHGIELRRRARRVGVRGPRRGSGQERQVAVRHGHGGEEARQHALHDDAAGRLSRPLGLDLLLLRRRGGFQEARACGLPLFFFVVRVTHGAAEALHGLVHRRGLVVVVAVRDRGPQELQAGLLRLHRGSETEH